MHPNFSEWYRLVSPDPRPETITQRWLTIESFAKTVKVADTIELARIVAGRIETSQTLDALRKAFQASDSSFLMRGNDLEVQVLVGAIAAQILASSPSYEADALALAIVCTNARGLRPAGAIPDLLGLSRNYLDVEGVRVRTATGETAKPAALQMTTVLDALKSATDVPGAVIQAHAALIALLQHAAKVFTYSEERADALASRLNFQEEETNILWWIFGETSRDLRIPIRDLETPIVALIAGKELADITFEIPAPYSATAFLERFLRTAKGRLAKTSIADAINASPREWRTAWHSSLEGNLPPADLCPVLAAVRNSLQTDDTAGWLPAFEKATLLSATKPLAPFALASQTYEEALLARLICERSRG